MPSYIDLRLRITLWPGTVVPTPPLRPWSEVEVDGDWIVWPVGGGTKAEPRELPPDFYMRELLELSPDDVEAAADLMRTYGKLFDLDNAELSESLLFDAADELQDIPDQGILWDAHSVRGIHRGIVALHLEAAQEAVRTWLACQDEGGLEELVEPHITDEWLQKLRQQNTDRDREWPESLDELRKFAISERISDLRETINSALSRFSIGLGDLSDRDPTIYSVSFLQLYNHLAEGMPIKHCANEPCPVRFARQRGTAEYGYHRTQGVKYCSRGCARAQAQRELRRRRRKAERSQSA
ncbi:hypothetical protein ACQP25_17125 [Microtetraspora malaysiensis]|uniref:hypothetical protein n=1 Tax=Microtetraspora malaysiensis TaxID=161358 RepID=UPI003D937FB7